MSPTIRSLALGAVAAVLAGCSDLAPTSPSAARTAQRLTRPLVIPSLIPSLTRQARTLDAASGKPTRTPLPDAAATFKFPAGLVCSFELAGEPVVNQEVVTTFPADANGDVVQLITGRLLERLTNVSTGASITANVSGPGRTTIHPDGSLTIELLGRSLWLFPAGVQTGPRAVIISGRTVATVSPTGQFTLISEGGHEEDVCAALS